MAKISVIVPVYNTEKYLRQCLDSLINQTFHDIEIICVNDGSTDRSLEILQKYAEKDSRIVVLTQENSKQGAARNRGLEIASGKYITFVDSDDWIELDYCEKLYNSAEECAVNIAAASMVREKIKKKQNHLKLLSKDVFYGANEIIKAIDEHLETAGKLYKFECIKNLRFLEEVLYEDAPYTIRAINQCNSLVTVPDTTYHYFSNPNSTIKAKQDERRRNDKIETQLDLLKYAEENNIKLSNNFVVKDERFLFKVKNYTDRREYYFCGIKIFTKYVPFNNKRVFVLYNTACLGDVLLCNSLCQNIKTIFPESKVVFVVDKPWYDVAKYQKGVDDVIIFDKKGEHKGLLGIIKFVRNFKYKKAYASIITYRNERNYIIAALTGAKNIILKSKKYEIKIQKSHDKELSTFTHKNIIGYPICYIVPNFAKKSVKEKFPNLNNYVVISSTSKREEKDMPVSTTIDLVKMFNAENKQVVFIGTGEKATIQSAILKENGCIFEDLINKTTITELGAILENASCVISVDTGTLHFAYAVNTPVVAVFYEQDFVKYWAPDCNLYPNTIVIQEEQSAYNIFNTTKSIMGGTI